MVRRSFMTPFGRYTLVRKLATGGMAEVFLARADGPMGFQKKCVVKRILPHFSDDPSFVQMFLAEARLAADLNHPNLVQIFDFGEVDGQYFIAMEYIDGPNLRVLNREVRDLHGPMQLTLAARIITSAAEGLHFAHELRDEQGQPVELVHRDISPDNVLVSRTGGVKVVDFGIAKAANQPHLTRSGMIKGKLAYMPPEQLAREPLDRRADIFALGVVLYELVSGEMPFDASSEVSIIQAIMGTEPLRRVHSRRGDVPAELDAIVARCLEKDRDARYPTCRELQADLERYIQAAGEVVGTQDIAALVEEGFKPESETGAVQVPSGALSGELLEATMPRAKSVSRTVPSGVKSVPGPVPARDVSTRASEPELPVVPERTPRKLLRHPQPQPPAELTEGSRPTTTTNAAVKPSLAPMLVGGVLLLALAGGIAYVALSAADKVEPKVTVLDAGAKAAPVALAPVQPSVVADAAVDVAPVEPPAVDAGRSPVEPEPIDAGAALVPVPVPVPVVPPVAPVHATGTLELRIRPYASVSIDGKPVGDTPLPPQVLPVGHHKIRLVNPSLSKDVVLDVLVKPGENVLKHNLKE